MKPHQERVIVELEELERRTVRLFKFIRTASASGGVGLEEMADLRSQYDIMSIYVLILKRRIARF